MFLEKHRRSILSLEANYERKVNPLLSTVKYFCWKWLMNFVKKLFQQSVALITTTTPSPEFPVLCYVVLEVTLEKKTIHSKV